MVKSKLRLGMMGSLALIIGVTTLGVMILFNGVLNLPVVVTFIFLVPFFLLQWVIGPKIVEYSMKVEQASEDRYPELHKIVDEICMKQKIDKPKVMISRIQLPNAFAYGTVFSGMKVAVTEGLLSHLESEEVEAVLGHELGHIKHHDSQVMMFLSILPALFMMVGRMLLWSSFFGGRRRNGAPIILIAVGAMVFYFILNLCILWFSRLREYYADQFSVDAVPDGARKLQEALAKINRGMAEMKEKRQRQQEGAVFSTGQRSRQQLTPLGSGFKALFISDPDLAQSERNLSDSQLVNKYKNQQPSFSEKLFELFTTHPNISKRLETLDKLNKV